MVRKFAVLFGIDPRTLAVFRMGLGTLLLADLAIRAVDLQAHYTDAGVVPRDLLALRFHGTWRWSFHMLGGSQLFQTVLFCLAATAAFGLVVGFRTRLATGVSWLLLISLHARNPLVLNGGDELLRLLLFWSMFLPLGGKWSIDGRRLGPRSAPPVLSLASAAILLQVCLVYSVSAYFKWYGIWASDDGLERILHFDSYAKPLAHTLLQYPALLTWFGSAVLWIELWGPVLVFSPWWTKPLRLVVIVTFALFHLGIQQSLTIGLFPYVCWLAWSLFLPDIFWRASSRAWHRVLRSTPPRASSPGSRPAGSLWPGYATRVVVGLMLVYILLWNADTMAGRWQRRWMPRGWYRLAEATLVEQHWDFFSHVPPADGWYILVARLNDGRVVDLMRDGKPADWESYEKPALISQRATNHRWRKLYRRLLGDHQTPYREALCRYYARRWDDSHADSARIISLELHYMQELDDGAEQPQSFIQRSLWTTD